MLILLVTVALAAASAVAPARAATPVRTPISNEFVFPDMCTFPVVVHTEGWQNVTPNGLEARTTTTLSTVDFSRSLTQHNVFNPGPNGTTIVEKIVLPDGGGVVGTMGHLTPSGFVGHQDAYSLYAATVCGSLGFA
jgi:hypothetical protein